MIMSRMMSSSERQKKPKNSTKKKKKGIIYDEKAQQVRVQVLHPREQMMKVVVYR